MEMMDIRNAKILSGEEKSLKGHVILWVKIKVPIYKILDGQGSFSGKVVKVSEKTISLLSHSVNKNSKEYNMWKTLQETQIEGAKRIIRENACEK